MRRRSWGVKQRPGQALVEYVIALALVAIGLVVVLLAFRGSAGGVMVGTGCRVAAAGSGSMSGCDGAGPGDAATPGYDDPGSTPRGGNGGHEDSGYGWGHKPPTPGPPPGVPGRGNDPPGDAGPLH